MINKLGCFYLPPCSMMIWFLHREKQRSMRITQAVLHKSFKSMFCCKADFYLTMNIASYIILITMLESFSRNFVLEQCFEEIDGTWIDVSVVVIVCKQKVKQSRFLTRYL